MPSVERSRRIFVFFVVYAIGEEPPRGLKPCRLHDKGMSGGAESQKRRWSGEEVRAV